MKLPTARAIESFSIAYTATQGIKWADLSANSTRAVRAGVSAGLMNMRVEGAPIGTALAMQTMEHASRDLREIGVELADKAPESAVQALYRIALSIDALRASTRPEDGEAI